MAVDLNREDVPGIKTWRHLACKLEVPSDVLQEFSGESTAKRSPTKEVIQWLAVRFPDTTLKDLIQALEKIQRNDASQIIKQFSDAFSEYKVYLVYTATILIKAPDISLLAKSRCEDFKNWTGTSSKDLMRLPTNTNSWIKQLARFLLYFIFSICSKCSSCTRWSAVKKICTRTLHNACRSVRSSVSRQASWCLQV